MKDFHFKQAAVEHAIQQELKWNEPQYIQQLAHTQLLVLWKLLSFAFSVFVSVVCYLSILVMKSGAAAPGALASLWREVGERGGAVYRSRWVQ